MSRRPRLTRRARVALGAKRGPRIPRSASIPIGVREEHPQGMGRIAPRHPGASSAHLQGESQYRRAAGRHIRRRITKSVTVDVPAQEADRGTGQFRTRSRSSSSRAARHGFRVPRTRSSARGAEGIHPRSREGAGVRASVPACSQGYGRRSQADADRRPLPRRRIVRRSHSRSQCERRCASAAKRGAARSCSSRYEGRVVTPDGLHGLVLGDLNSRARQIQVTGHGGNAKRRQRDGAVNNMFGYVSHLRSHSQGRATSHAVENHYAEVPRAVAEESRRSSHDRAQR